MSWTLCGGGGSGGSSIDAFPPDATGQNVSQTQVATLQNNTVDSVAGTDIDTFVEVAQSGLSFPNQIYDTGNLDLSPSTMRLTNNSGRPFSFEVEMSGELISDSSVNAAIFGLRLNSSNGIGTGTLRKLPSGLTTGQLSIDIGFGTKGAFTLANGDSVWLEVSKSVVGTLIIQSALILIKPTW